jgi:LEA14-like dessication related protein
MNRKLILLAAAALALSACTALRLLHSAKLKPPQVSFVSYRFIGADASQANLEFTLAAYNPNAIGLRNVNIGYELFNQDRRFLHGGDIAVELKPKDTTRIVVPATVVYREVFKAAGPAAEHLLLDRRSIPVRIDALIAGNPTVYDEKEAGGLFQFSLKLSRTEIIPIPDSFYRDAGKAAMRSLRKMF